MRSTRGSTTRRQFLAVLAGGSVAGLLQACAPQPASTPSATSAPAPAGQPAKAGTTPATTAPATKSFAGTQLTALLIGGGSYEKLYARIPEWEQRTSAKADTAARMAHAEMNSRVTREYASGKPTFDWHSNHTGTWKNWQNFLEPLDAYLDPADRDDFSPSIMDIAAGDGKVWIVPRHVDVQLTYYRRDLFENPTEQQNFKAKYGYDLQVPETWQQWRDTAEFFTRPPDMFGFAWAVSNGTPFFFEQLMNAGGQPFDDHNRPAWNGPEGIKTLEFLVSLYRAVAPPGSINYQWDDLAQLFRQGKLAFYPEWPGWYAAAKDPQRSLVHDTFSVAQRPYGPAGPDKRKTWGEAHGFSISRSSKVKEASADLIRYITSADSEFYESQEGGFIPVRKSVLKRVHDEAAKSPDPRDKHRMELLDEAISKYFLSLGSLNRQIPNFNTIAYPIIQPILERALSGQMSAADAAAQSAREVEAKFAEKNLLK